MVDNVCNSSVNFSFKSSFLSLFSYFISSLKASISSCESFFVTTSCFSLTRSFLSLFYFLRSSSNVLFFLFDLFGFFDCPFQPFGSFSGAKINEQFSKISLLTIPFVASIFFDLLHFLEVFLVFLLSLIVLHFF